MNSLKLKKGDQVIVTTGRDKGKTGKISKVYPKENLVLVENVNLVKKHTKPSMKSSGGIVSVEKAINVSNVAYLDPKLNIATKIGYRVLENGKKVRFAKKSNETLD